MIATMSRMSTAFLPTIKCSDCNAEIEISAMGDHICVTAPSLPISKPRLFEAPVKKSIPLASTGVMRSLKAPPARIDSVSANRPPAPHTQYSSNRSKVGLRSISPTMSETSQRSGRTAMSPTLFRPPSSEISVSQDSAFPPFPTSKSRSATPTTPSDPASTFSTDDQSFERQPGTNVLHGPTSSKQIGSSVLQRMNSIAPGPFNINKSANQSVPGHQRTATTISNKDFVRSSYSSNGSIHSRQASISASTHPRNPSLSSISGGPRSTLHRVAADSPTLPVMPPLFKDLSSSPERIQNAKSTRPIEALSQVGRSHTYPLEGGQEAKAQKEKPPATRRPSEAAAVMKPLHEIGSTSTFKSSRSMKGRNAVPTTGLHGPGIFDPKFDLKQDSSNNTVAEKTTQSPKAIHAPTLGQNPYHTPTESNSSNESSGSESRSVSSRSTPPLSGSPQRSKRRPSQTGHTDSLIQDFRFGTEQVPVINEPVPHRMPPPSFSRPIYTRPADPPPSLKNAATLSPDSPTDPAIQSGRPSPVKIPSDYNAPIVPLQNGNLRLSPAPPPPPAVPVSPVRKPTTVSKGKCRGCDELIKGKSVSSADGRLTGRYHRNCFVCKTCREPFQTADFYVLDNHPFCARHYHQLNGSLCKSCDKGIEGQYLETESKQKFHPYCFTCQDCHKILRDDYFEMNGKTYCEQHALRAAQQTSLLGPGRRHPERRTTRLMMM